MSGGRGLQESVYILNAEIRRSRTTLWWRKRNEDAAKELNKVNSYDLINTYNRLICLCIEHTSQVDIITYSLPNFAILQIFPAS